ncbi:MAG: PD40 domain-containing protein [Rhodopirellula sp.]|nr:PD40 domain-containing protein [Rhodopirellula sp.]
MMRRDTGRVLLAIVVSLCGALYARVSVADDPNAHELTASETTLIRITDDGYFKQRPAWSPDGQHLVFARHRGTTIFLWLRNLESGEEERLTKTEYPEYDAVFSPDGKELLFAYDKASPNQGDIEVHRLDFESRKPTPVAVTEGTLSHEESPCWSPNGKRIAFTSTRHGNQELYVANRDGTEPLRLTSDPAIDSHPDWSPDGQRIVFSTNRWGDLELASISPDGTGLTRLTTSPGLDDYPAWSPDGKRIAYTSNRDRNLEIYLLDPVTGHDENVTRSSAIDNFPAWTPDGRLSFVSNRDEGFDIYVTKAVVGNK